MMNRTQLDKMWDHIRQVNGIGLRVIAAIPADKIDARPVPKMRTPKELVVHMYGTVLRAMTESVLSGTFVEPTEDKTCESIKSKDDLMKYCLSSWDAADKATTAMTDAKLQGDVKTPWGSDFPGFVMYGCLHDEYLHHRGQLYTYLRALGVEPPMMWDFEHNATAFLPKAKASA